MSVGIRVRKQSFNSRLLGSIFMLVLGSYHLFTRGAEFSISYGIACIGGAFLNFALGIGGRARIPIFWVGAGLLGVAVLCLIAKVMLG